MDSRNIRNPYHGIDDLQSDFGDEEPERKKRRGDFLEKEYPGEEPKKKRNEGRAGFEEEHGRMHRRMSKMMSMNAYERHKEMINLYYLSYPGSTKLLDRKVQDEKTDLDVLEEHHKFVWSAEDEKNVEDSWEKRMAKKYYDKLFKEYCIVDLSMYKTNKIGMRWCTEKEVKEGKGQLICGARKCAETAGLASWEVNFTYKEDNRSKSTLVKARLCPRCSEKLNYGSEKRRVKQKKRRIHSWEKEKKKKERDEEEYLTMDDTDEKEKKEADKDRPSTSTSTLSSSTDVWEGPAPVETEKSVDDEIDEFLDDLFL